MPMTSLYIHATPLTAKQSHVHTHNGDNYDTMHTWSKVTTVMLLELTMTFTIANMLKISQRCQVLETPTLLG